MHYKHKYLSPLYCSHRLQVTWWMLTSPGLWLSMREEIALMGLWPISQFLLPSALKPLLDWEKGTIQSLEMSFNGGFQEAQENIVHGWQKNASLSMKQHSKKCKERKKGQNKPIEKKNGKSSWINWVKINGSRTSSNRFHRGFNSLNFLQQAVKNQGSCWLVETRWHWQAAF